MTADLVTDEGGVKRLIAGGAMPQRVACWEWNGKRHYALVYEGIGGRFAFFNEDRDSIGIRQTIEQANMILKDNELDVLAR
jgi:hypothetical protein